MRLYLVRHAAVTVRRDRPPADWHLSPEGRAGVAALADESCWANVSRLCTSPEPKAVATAQRIAARHGLPVVIERDLRETDGRAWTEPARHRELVRRYLAGEAVDAWEPRAAALDRVRSCIDAIVQRHAGEDAAVVSHGLVLTLWLTDLLGLDEAASHELSARMRLPDLAIVDRGERRVERDFGGG